MRAKLSGHPGGWLCTGLALLGFAQPEITAIVVGALTCVAVFWSQHEIDLALRSRDRHLGRVTRLLNAIQSVTAGIVVAGLFEVATGGTSWRIRIAGATAFAAAGWMGAWIFEYARRRGIRAEIWGALKGVVPCGLIFSLVYNLVLPGLGLTDVAGAVVSAGFSRTLTTAIDGIRSLSIYLDQLVYYVLSSVLGQMAARLVVLFLSVKAAYGLTVIGPLCFSCALVRERGTSPHEHFPPSMY
ncbi:MAG: hypothetical protein KatS3mg110_0603 [Pirellulaceae bacterium]|nr:MAG: hypothetical protein KatS3mg110_0603 [Pirellulaceae bacterium]